MTRPWYEQAFGAHYPRLYAHRDQDEARRCLDLLQALVPLAPENGMVLDLGCGDGRHLETLLLQGHRAFGLDLSAALLGVASSRPEEPAVIRGDMRHLPLMDGCCEAVLSLFTAFGYFGPLEANSSVVAEVARVLRPGGCWYLDYLDADRIQEELGDGQPRARQRDVGGLKIQETRRLAASGDRVRKDVEMDIGSPDGPLRYTEEVALFSLQDMDQLASRYGLRRMAGAGSYDGAALGEGDRWILIFRKEGA